MPIAPESYLNALRFRKIVWQPEHLVREVPPVADIEPTKKYPNDGANNPMKGYFVDIIV